MSITSKENDIFFNHTFHFGEEVAILVNKESNCIGFFAVKTHYGYTGDIYVCGVLPEYHRNGIGKALYNTAEAYLKQNGCKYMIVKMLSETVNYEPYARTRAFYKSVGFEPLITLTEMWDEKNRCLIMLT